jgi:hypothetical protein
MNTNAILGDPPIPATRFDQSQKVSRHTSSRFAELNIGASL